MLRRASSDWTWKLITIAPRWDPSDARSYSVEGLRERLDDVRARWVRCWEGGLAAEGLAAAYWRAECSIGGHVHAHILYRGPWLSPGWLAELAGCYVDVRMVRAKRRDGDMSSAIKDAVREAVKYTLKSPSILHRAWVAGAEFRTPHPELAASWVLATRRRHIVDAYGVMIDAIRAEKACKPDAEGDPDLDACSSCGSIDLDEPETVRVADIARSVWSFTRCAKTPWGQALPARIRVVRG